MASVATSAPDGVGPSALPEDAVITAPDRTTGIPAAFADPAPSLALTPAQREQLAQIQDDFVRQIGGTQRDPADPAYGAAWRDAQWLADQRFRAIFGNEAFLQQQRAANLQASHAAENP